MRDAIGGLVNIWMILIFITLVSGFMAFNINYAKAFRVKNNIITNIEKYNGNCDQKKECLESINQYIRDIGYSSPPMIQEGNEECYDEGYCIEKISPEIEDEYNNTLNDTYYSVRTSITIDIPIIRNVMPHITFFQVSGDTALMKN